MSGINKCEATIVYIAGYGRSGSTLLDIILSNVDGVRSLGEVANFFEVCGDPESESILTNNFWGEVRKGVSSCLSYRGDTADVFIEASHNQRKIEKFWSGWRLFLPSRQNSINSYKIAVDCLFHSISNASDREKIFVDSSKTAWLSSWRPYFLHKAGYRVKMIHLVRDGRSVIGSFLKGDNVKMQKGLDDVSFRAPVTRSIIGWVGANIAAFVNRKFIPDGGSYLLRYEDLVSDTKHELKELGKFLGIDLMPVARRLTENKELRIEYVGFSGNRIINQDSITIDRSLVRLPTLRPLYLLYYWLMAGWLHKIIYK